MKWFMPLVLLWICTLGEVMKFGKSSLFLGESSTTSHLKLSRHTSSRRLSSKTALLASQKSQIGQKNSQISHDTHSLIVHSLDSIPAQSQYCVEVSIGTPRQYFDLVVDTGSADVWVQGTDCAGCSLSGKRFNSNNSLTFTNSCREASKEDCTFLNKYGSGISKGTIGQDALWIGSLLVANNLHIGVTSNVGGEIAQILQGSGILGLGFPALAQYSNPAVVSFIDSFALELNSDSGTLSINTILEKYNSNLFHWITIPIEMYSSENDFWVLGLPELKINGVSVCGGGERRCQAVVDSGTSMIAVPSRLWAKLSTIYEELGCFRSVTNGLYVCHNDRIPDVQMLLGTKIGYEMSLLPKTYATPSEFGAQYSDINIFRSPLDMDLIILGDIFMTQYYTVFSVTNKSISLATNTTPFIKKDIPNSEQPTFWNSVNEHRVMKWLIVAFFTFFILSIFYCTCMELSKRWKSSDTQVPISDEALLKQLLNDSSDKTTDLDVYCEAEDSQA